MSKGLYNMQDTQLQNIQHTPFYNCHLNSNAKLVNFSNYTLPINYGSQIKEHECVRLDAGMFDVSHMCITDITGIDAKNFIRNLISNDVNKLDRYGVGKALYSAMLNPEAGIIDDLIVYLMPFGYRLITNAATRAKDLSWIRDVAINNGNHTINNNNPLPYDITIIEQNHLAMLAVQGPNAISKFTQAFPETATALSNLKPFTAIDLSGLFIAKTGYTGEDGIEVLLPEFQATELWNKLIDSGVTPCGLGARDTLRLEAGMNLYGQDMDESATPSECGMDWVVDLTDPTRNFIGRESYLKLKQLPHATQIGLILKGRGILRSGQKIIIANDEAGVITSGTFSPTIKQSIAMARLSPNFNNDANYNNISIYVDIRGNLEPVQLVSLPFVRNGKLLYSKF
jgi:aminomethyltransferase